jgi:uncharacterized protein (TIGR02118 family)
MAQLLVLYKTPKDAAAFDKYYFEKHVPIAKAIPGVRKYEVSQGPVNTPAGPSDIHLVAILQFDSLAALAQGLGSPQGQAAAGDLPNFASGGVELLMFDSREV